MHLEVIGGSGTYRPGACNIGPAEIARRRRAAAAGVVATLGLATVLVAVGAPPAARLLLFPVLAGTLVAIEQVRRRFCVHFGLSGLRNFGVLGREEAVEDAEARAADRRTAAFVIGYCSLIAVVVTLVFVALAT